MPSPFPGIDPYLEDHRLWPEFQGTLVEAVKDSVQVNLPANYELRTGTRRYASEPGDPRPEEYCEPFVEIFRKDDGQLVTLIEVVSIANRTTQAGRAAYLEKRAQGAGLEVRNR